jgi:hypothetical protein
MVTEYCHDQDHFLFVSFFAVIYGALRIYGHFDWQRDKKELRDRLNQNLPFEGIKIFNENELEGLPAPVQRYFRAVLKPNSGIIKRVDLRHIGAFNMGETSAKWKPFSSDQNVVTHPPGFDWDGRIAIMPGMNVHVHDAYVAGEGILQAKLLGVLPFVNSRDRSETAKGELMRYLGEAVWYPTALLPSQGVHWKAIDDNNARATLIDGDTMVSLDFHFTDYGVIDTIHTDSRPRMLNGKLVNSAWDIRVSSYKTFQDIRVPTEGEVAWILPEGPYPYWRGRVEDARYEFFAP